MAKTPQTVKHKTTYDIAEELGIMALTPSQLEPKLIHCAEVGMPALVLGRPGTGKTEIIAKITAQLEKRLIVERLNGRDPTDMGLPYIYDDRAGIKRHAWTSPDWYQTAADVLEAEYPGGWTLFFDETAQGLPAMQNRIGEILNEKQLNGVRAHSKLWVVLASNFAQDKAATYPIPRQILNRVMVMILAQETDDFLRYCSTHLIRPEIAAFVKLFPDCLDSYDPDSMVNCTARSLCSLSPLLDRNPSIEDELALYAGRIGRGYGSQFVGFLRTYRNLTPLEEIIKNPKRAKVPDEDQTDVMCAMAAMLGRAITPKNAAPVIEYLLRLPSEFCVFALRDAHRDPVRGPELKKCRAMTEWAAEHGDVIS